MLIRIVRMSFVPEKVDTFLTLFKERRERIRTFPGCTRLDLLRDANKPNVFYTYSFWLDENYLEQYRHSELFRDTWKHTKQLFNDRPQAFSLDKIPELSD